MVRGTDLTNPLSPLLESLYGGLLEADPWSAFLQLLADSVGASYATLILTSEGEAPGTIVTPGANPRTAEDYADTMFAADPFIGLPEGQVVSFDEFVADTSIDPAFRTFLETSGSTQILGVDLRTSSGSEARLRLTRDRSRPAFDPHVRATLTALVPHLRIALRLFTRMETGTAEQGVYRSAFGRMAVATLMLDRAATVVRSNEVADRLLGSGRGLSVRNGKLCFAARDAASQLAKLLASPLPAGDSTRFRIPQAHGNSDLSAVARLLPSPAYAAGNEPVLALFIADPAQSIDANPDVLRDMFQLTPTEAQLAAELASSGTTLVEAARALGMAHNTARSHLRSIFAKTGARRQSQLFHLVRASLAGFDSELET